MKDKSQQIPNTNKAQGDKKIPPEIITKEILPGEIITKGFGSAKKPSTKPSPPSTTKDKRSEH